MPKVGLQLWTVKDESEKDFFRTLREVARIGYDGVEFAGYYDVDAESLYALMKETGLSTAATHISFDRLETALDQEIAFAKAIDCPTLICPWLPEEDRNSETAAYHTADRLNRIGLACKDAGLKLLYHIHGYEFARFDTKTVMDIFLERTDPQAVQFEFDTYWVEAAGIDCVSYYRQIGHRCPYIHLKDFNNHQELHDVEIGSGLLNTTGMLAEAVKKGADWVVVEQEKFTMPVLESASISHSQLRSLMSEISC